MTGAKMAEMAGTFINADLRVSATWCHGSGQSLFNDRTSQEFATVDLSVGEGQPPVFLRQSPPHFDFDEGGELLPNFWDPFRDPARHRPLLRSVWTFQERYLSHRMLHFTEHEISWPCRQTYACQCGMEIFDVDDVFGSDDEDEDDEVSVDSDDFDSNDKFIRGEEEDRNEDIIEYDRTYTAVIDTNWKSRSETDNSEVGEDTSARMEVATTPVRVLTVTVSFVLPKTTAAGRTILPITLRLRIMAPSSFLPQKAREALRSASTRMRVAPKPRTTRAKRVRSTPTMQPSRRRTEKIHIGTKGLSTIRSAS